MRNSAFLLFALIAACGGEAPQPLVAKPLPPAPSASTDNTTKITLPNATQRAPKAPVALEEYFKTRRTRGDLSFSEGDKLVAYVSDEGGRPDVWVRATDGSGAPRQLTHVDGFLAGFAFAPKGDHFVYEADHGGDELPHLYLTNSNGDSPKDLVADYGPGRRTEFRGWADDGKTFLFMSNARDEKVMDLYEYDLAKSKATMLWQADAKLAVGQISHDHGAWILREQLSDANDNLYLVKRGQKKPELLTKHDGDALFDAADFSKDNRTLYVTSDVEGEFTALYAIDTATKKRTSVLKEEWDVEGAAFSRSFKLFATETNVDGARKLVVTDTKTNKPVSLPAPPPGSEWHIADFSNTDRYLGLLQSGDTAPATLFIVDLKTGTATKLFETLPDSLKDRSMVAGESVKVPSFDGKNVPAFVYKPAGAGPFPAVIDVHGGPTAQSRRDFNRFRQYLVSKGYAVMVPNVRGSTGYGKTWTKLDNMDLGGGPLKDVVACKQWLVANANVAADKVVVLGGSYGGYMALAAATFTPKEFVANVDYFGPSDLKTLTESFPPYWAAFATYVYKKFGDPKSPADAQYQHDRSPLFFADKIERPLLVVQGEKDARVKKDQSDRIVAELKKRSVPVHYLVLENEGHGFSKNENYLKVYALTDKFLDRYVFGDASVEVGP